MLIITRHNGESLYIGEEIKVTVIKVAKNYVKIGIAAPEDVEIWREEIAPEEWIKDE